MRKVKKIMIKLIGANNFRVLVVYVSRLINNFHKKVFIGVEEEKYKTIEVKNRNISFGYYDKPANNNKKVLFLSTPKDTKEPAQIFYEDLEKKEDVFICNTNAWNFQMGSRLMWLDDNKIICNDYKQGFGYISKIVNIKENKISEYSFPIYDISKDNQYSFYMDFNVLNYFRPGYGYSNEKVDINEKQNENGIYKGSFKENFSEKIISMQNIIKYDMNDCRDAQYNYINHICCSQYDDVLMFFHLWINSEGLLRNRVFVIDYFGNILNVLKDFDRASHYCFKDKEHILLTVVSEGKIQYRLYNIKTGKYRLFEFLNVDGHPTYIDSERFITDTYPDHNGMQHIFLCDETKIIYEIAQIFHNPHKNDEYRCDLHPRYHNGILTFDSITNKYRKENIIEIELQDVLKVKNIYEKMSDDQKIYMFLNHTIEFNRINYLYNRIFNFSYKAHILVNKMLRTKSRIKIDYYFNKLQKNYSMWISPTCKIGRNVHFMHLDGVTIGSGVKIGDNCTIYQQVTLGKEKDKFPDIGNNVTIYAGAKVIGGIKIGENAVIGTNAVVLQDIPSNSIAVGVPAKIIKRGT